MNLLDPKRILMAPLANDDGSDAGGGDTDRGDDFVANDDADVDQEDAAGKKVADSGAGDDAAGKKDDKAGEDKDKGIQIPKARFDEAQAKARKQVEAAEERARALEAKLKVQESGLDAEKANKEIADLEELLDQAIADGDKDKKVAIRAQIRERTQALADAGAERKAQYATAMAIERVRYDAQVALLEAAHPQMNPDDADKYDEELTGELMELKAAYEAGGMGSTEALKKAAKYVFKTAPAEIKKDEPKPTDEEKKAAADKAAKMKEDAIRRGLEAKGKQPAADADKTGKASDTAGKRAEDLKPSRMSDKEFSKLSEEQMAQLRGDTL